MGSHMMFPFSKGYLALLGVGRSLPAEPCVTVQKPEKTKCLSAIGRHGL